MYVCVCVFVCVRSVSSGAHGVPGRSVGVLLRSPLPSLLASRSNVLPFGLFALLIRAPHSLAVLLHSLGVPIADQLEELLVPQPGVGARQRGGQQSPGANAGAWLGAQRGVTQSCRFLSSLIIRPVDRRLHPLASEHLQRDA